MRSPQQSAANEHTMASCEASGGTMAAMDPDVSTAAICTSRPNDICPLNSKDRNRSWLLTPRTLRRLRVPDMPIKTAGIAKGLVPLF